MLPGGFFFLATIRLEMAPGESKVFRSSDGLAGTKVEGDENHAGPPASVARGWRLFPIPWCPGV